MLNISSQKPSFFAFATVKRSISYLSVITILSLGIYAQGTLEMFSSSNPGPGNGPTLFATADLMLDSPPLPQTSHITVTAFLSNQQYSGIGTGAGNPVVMFGAGPRATGGSSPTSHPVFVPLNHSDSPQDAFYDSLPGGGGIEVADNYGFQLFTSIRQWTSPPVFTPSPTSKIYMADLTLNFSQPVDDPYLHLAGLGGYGMLVGPPMRSLNFATELTLTTPGVTLVSLNGNGQIFTFGNEINHGAPFGPQPWWAECVPTSIPPGVAGRAGCGTVVAVGTGITSLTFQVYYRGSPSNEPLWLAFPSTSHAGDMWTLGVSVPLTTTSANASIGGRVVTAGGRGIANALISVSDKEGQVRTVMTNPFGYYRVDGLRVGHSYVVQIGSKRYQFADPVRLINLADELMYVDFISTN